jgi:hypothetical protein
LGVVQVEYSQAGVACHGYRYQPDSHISCSQKHYAAINR